MNVNPLTTEHRDGFVTLLVGPTAWFLFFLLAYAITGTWCARFANGGSQGFMRALVIAAAVLAVTVIVVAAAATARRLRHVNAAGNEDDWEAERPVFIDIVGLMLSAASVLGVIWLTIGVLIHPVC